MAASQPLELPPDMARDAAEKLKACAQAMESRGLHPPVPLASIPGIRRVWAFSNFIAIPPAVAPTERALTTSSPLLIPPVAIIGRPTSTSLTDTGVGRPQFQNVLPSLASLSPPR